MSGATKNDRFLTVVIWVVLVLALFQGTLVIYREWGPRNSLTTFTLPPDVPDWRGERLPELSSLLPIEQASYQNELSNPVTIIAFLRTSCPACTEAKPALEAMRRTNLNTGIIGVFAEPEDVVHNYQAAYPSFVDSTGLVFDAFGVTSIPMFLIVRDGRVVEQVVGWSPAVGKRLEALAGR